MKKKIVFLSGTRADFGKIKSIIKLISNEFDIKIYVTGMHLLNEFGNTYKEIQKVFPKKIIYKKNNQIKDASLDITLAQTIFQFSNFIKQYKPDMIIAHGDRAEAFAAAIVGSLNNILLGHIEGGERSGNIDEHIRHSISKLAHIHFVSNKSAKQRLVKLGEREDKIFIVGNPDIDILKSKFLPEINKIKKRYDIQFEDYIIFLFHPDNNPKSIISQNLKKIINSLKLSKKKIIFIYPNNDFGSDVVIKTFKTSMRNNKNFKLIKSMRFEYFLGLLKNSKLIIGNSSSGIHEAPFYGVPTINIGDRQKNRAKIESISNIDFNTNKILKLINKLYSVKFSQDKTFGDGRSAEKIYLKLKSNKIWQTKTQKHLSY